MNLAHLHLLLNHFPIIGTFIVLLLLVAGRYLKTQTIINTAAVLLVGIALITIPAFFTGEPAEEAVEHLPGISHHLIHEHEEAAELAFWLMNITGVIALGYLLLQRMKMAIAQQMIWVLLLASFITCLLMARVGNEGGKIRHSELNTSTTNAASLNTNEEEEHEQH